MLAQSSLNSSPEPSLCDILAAVQKCNVNITSLADQTAYIKLNISLLRLDMQKVTENLTGMVNRFNVMEEELSK